MSKIRGTQYRKTKALRTIANTGRKVGLISAKSNESEPISLGILNYQPGVDYTYLGDGGDTRIIHRASVTNISNLGERGLVIRVSLRESSNKFGGRI